MTNLKRVFKENTHNGFFKALASFGRAMHRLYENRNIEPYSNGEWRMLKKLASFDPKIIVDGGAHVGKYTLAATRACPTAQIYSFEPVKSTFEQLLRRIEGEPQVEPINMGLYHQETQKQIYLFGSSSHSTIYKPKGLSYQSQSQSEISLYRGDMWMKEQGIEKIDLLKLDLEGAEYDALLGFENALQQRQIRLIQFEYGYLNITTKRLLVDFYELLEGHGYQVGKLFPKVVEFRPYHFKYEDFLGPNFVAVGRDDQALIQRLERK